MALSPLELKSSSAADIFYAPLRALAGAGPGAIATRNFSASASAGEETLPQLTPVAMVSGGLVPWAYVDGNQTEGTAEVLVGFTWPEEIQLSASGEDDRVGSIMVIGQVDYRDVPLPASPNGGSQAQLNTAMSALTVRQRNLQITGGLSVTL